MVRRKCTEFPRRLHGAATPCGQARDAGSPLHSCCHYPFRFQRLLAHPTPYVRPLAQAGHVRWVGSRGHGRRLKGQSVDPARRTIHKLSRGWIMDCRGRTTHRFVWFRQLDHCGMRPEQATALRPVLAWADGCSREVAGAAASVDVCPEFETFSVCDGASEAESKFALAPYCAVLYF